MTEDQIYDAKLLKEAYAEIAADLRDFLKRHERPSSASDAVHNAAHLMSVAERYDRLTRAVLDLHGKTSV